ncbi:hypothetical protein [Rhizobacter sp. LjRoot28]|uniref:hypothetical protein n=1 Tax=Rhizobacter sp. LjRoot28 TaxID=3342309 RepID=UPI003ED0B112
MRLPELRSTLFLLAALAAWVSAPAADLPDGWRARPAAGGTLYEAVGLPAGHVFSLLAPAAVQVGDASAAQAFERAKAAATQDLDGPLRCEAAQVESGSVRQQCRSGAVNASFVMLPVRNGSARVLRILAAGEESALERRKEGFSVAMKRETERWRAEATGAGGTPAATAPPAQTTTPAKARPSDRALAEASRKEARAAIERAIRTVPGKGLKPGDYDTVLFSWDQRYQVTGLQYSETVYLLLNDGAAYTGLAIPPEDFDAAASRRLQPDRWVQWRRDGGKYQVRRDASSEWKTLKAWPAVPGRRDERLNGTFTHSSYGSFGGLGGWASTNSLVFGADGRFEELSHTTHGTGVVQAGNGYTGGSAGGHSGKGSWGTSSGTQGPGAGGEGGTVTAGSQTSRNDGSAYTGRYRIDGWRLSLERDNGTVEHQLFLYTTEKREDLHIGGSGYASAAKKSRR